MDSDQRAAAAVVVVEDIAIMILTATITPSRDLQPVLLTKLLKLLRVRQTARIHTRSVGCANSSDPRWKY